MSDVTSSTRATILFDGPPDMDFVGLMNDLKRPFRNIALDFDEIEVDEYLYALFTSDRLTLRISRGQVPVSKTVLEKAGRPANPNASDAELKRVMRDYSDTITVSVADGATRSVPERLRVSVCYHVVRHLLQNYEAAGVHWQHTNTFFTANEFASPTDAQHSTRNRKTNFASATARRPQFKVVPGHVGAAEIENAQIVDIPHAAEGREKFAAGYMGVAENHTRLDESFAQAVDPEHAIIHEAEEAVPHQRSWKDILPNIAPSEEKLRKSRLAIFASDLIEIEDVKLEAPSQEVSLPEQLTVYVMTVTMMVMAFPAGFAMMIYNILAGESLKMTARAMALTGCAIGMDFAGVTSAVFGVI